MYNILTRCVTLATTTYLVLTDVLVTFYILGFVQDR